MSPSGFDVHSRRDLGGARQNFPWARAQTQYGGRKFWAHKWATFPISNVKGAPFIIRFRKAKGIAFVAYLLDLKQAPSLLHFRRISGFSDIGVHGNSRSALASKIPGESLKERGICF